MTTKAPSRVPPPIPPRRNTQKSLAGASLKEAVSIQEKQPTVEKAVKEEDELPLEALAAKRSGEVKPPVPTQSIPP